MKIDLDCISKIVSSLDVDTLKALNLKLIRAMAIVMLEIEKRPKRHLRLVREEEEEEVFEELMQFSSVAEEE